MKGHPCVDGEREDRSRVPNDEGLQDCRSTLKMGKATERFRPLHKGE